MKIKHTGMIVSSSRSVRESTTRGLSGLVDMNGAFGVLADGYRYCREHRPDMVFMDITHDPDTGLAMVRRMKADIPELTVFLLHESADPNIILKGFRSGATDFLQTQLKGKSLVSSVKNALARSRGRKKQAELYTVFSLKGGLGVTTLTMNLADHIREITGDKVLLLDLNLFMGDITGYLDLAPGFTPYDLIADMKRMDKELLFSSLYRHERGFHILTTPEEINDSESVSIADIQEMVLLLKTHFDYIIADLPHDLSERTLKVLSMTDRLLVLVQQNIPSAKSVQKVLEFLNDIDFEAHRVSILANRYLKNSDLTLSDLENIFQQKIVYTVDNNYPLFNRAANSCKTLNQTAAAGRINRQIAKAAAGLTGMAEPVQTGWISRLLKGRP